MVVVTVELWPHGDESQRRTIGVAKISNDGTGSADLGNYEVELSHSGVYYGRPGTWKRGTVRNHLRRLSPYHLVLSALRNALGIR